MMWNVMKKQMHQQKNKLAFFLCLLTSFPLVFAEGTYAPKNTSHAMLTDNKLHIYFCGTGVPQVNAQYIRKPSCLAIIANGQFMLFDGGEGAIQTLAGMGLPFQSIQTIFVTHLHSDHIAGIGEVIDASWLSGRKNPITVYGPEGITQVMRGFNTVYKHDVFFRVAGAPNVLNAGLASAKVEKINASKDAKQIWENAGIKVSAFTVDHLPVYPALGYKVEYNGCKIVISGDTKITSSLADNAKDADILINEVVSQPLYGASFTDADKNNPDLQKHFQQVFSYHSASYELAKMAQQAKVKHLYLTHLLPAIPANDDEAKKSFITGMDKYYSGPITVADDGDEVQVSGSDCQITYVKATANPLIKMTRPK